MSTIEIICLSITICVMILPIVISVVYSKKIKHIKNLHSEEINYYVEELESIKNEFETETTSLEQEYLEEHTNAINAMHYSDLTYEIVNDVIDNIFDEIWVNKYFMNYTLKELATIPDLDAEIRGITKDVYDALSINVKHNMLKYYTENYVITKITRRATIVLMEYIKTHKPPSK